MALTIAKLQQIVYGMNMNHVNEDCSECAERVKQALGRGQLCSYIAKDPSSDRLLTLAINKTLLQYNYHTVLIVTLNGSKIVVDLTNPHKLILECSYEAELKKLNFGKSLYKFSGDLSRPMMNTIFYSKLQGTRWQL